MSETLLVINTNKVMSEPTRESFKDACRRWQCDYVEVTESSAPYHHAALKLSAFDLVDHDRILVVDSDMIIRSDMPNIFELTEPTKFYAVKNQQAHFPPAYRINTLLVREEIARIISNGKQAPIFDANFIAENFFNSGFCVISREYHKEIYDLAKYLFEGSHVQWWDQIPLNIAVSAHGGYEELPPNFNYQFPPAQGPMQHYVYHFAGDPTRYDTLKKINWIATDPRVQSRENFHILINDMELEIGVELGTQQGLYAEYLLQNTKLFLYMVDAWRYIDGYNDIANIPDSGHMLNLSRTKKRVRHYPGRWKIIKEFSVLAANQFGDNDIDFIYIDADHSYDATLLDLKAWYPKVRAGGLIAGHDFLDGENICGSEFGVRSAVFEFLKDKTHTLYITSEAWPSWWYVKD